MEATQRQFLRLAQLALDGVATEAERAQLSELSAAHPEFVSLIADEIMIDAFLKWHSGNIVEDLPGLEPVVQGELESRTRTNRGRSSLRSWAIAASLLLATGLAVWKYYGISPNEGLIADIVDQRGVTWAADCTALVAGDAIRPGRLSSTSGDYTLQFRDGSTVRVSGQTSLDIKSKMLVQLDRGQATANVPPNSTGFTITSALVDVIDQGTEFGISVDNGRADVIVFEGKVDLQSNVNRNDAQTQLTQGDCIKINQAGAISRVADVRRDLVGRWWTDNRETLGGVISRVSDTIHMDGGGKSFACYQTTIEGLQDDSNAYSDNPHHQWNGLTAAGLPSFLQGADYIKTFNDYRYIEHFKLKVELARPANLYVFFDDRVPPPAWLSSQFKDTGVDIGLDEGPWLLKPDELSEVDQKLYRTLDVNTTANGGGKSIDNKFSVWWRRCETGGAVTLGSPGERGSDQAGIGGNWGRAMYGIAATAGDAAPPPTVELDSGDLKVDGQK